MRITVLAILAGSFVAGPAVAEMSLSGTDDAALPFERMIDTGTVRERMGDRSLSLGRASDSGVTVGGDARMGVVFDGEDWQLTNRVRVGLAFDGQTDQGLRFGMRVRLDEARDAARGVAGSVYIAGDFGTLSFGDVHSADRALVGQLHGVGLTGLGDFNELGYSAGGGTANGLFAR